MDDLPKTDHDQDQNTKEKPIEIGSFDQKSPLSQTQSSSIEPPKAMPPLPETDEKPSEVKIIGEPEVKQTAPEVTNITTSPPENKNKKLKNISAIIGLLIIIIALPLSLLLVKQRQEIRKKAEAPGLSGSISFCGITISPTGQSFSNGTYTFTYSITGSGHTVKVHTYGCACVEGARGSCGTNSGKCKGNSFTTQTPYSGSITAPKIGDDCGTYQADVYVVSVDGNTACHNN